MTDTNLEGSPATRRSSSLLPGLWRQVIDKAGITDAVANYSYPGSGTEEDPFEVIWIPGDERNPHNFSPGAKWFVTFVVALETFVVALCSSAYTGGLNQIMVEFNIGEELSVLGVSLFVTGFAIGPLLWAPLSEVFGRQPVFLGTYAAFTIFNVGCGYAREVWVLAILRFCAGAFGSSPLTNAGAVVADMFSAAERGLATSIFAAAPFLGPLLGPMIGGFLGQSAGWRWIMKFLAILSGLFWIAGVLFVPETYSPILLRTRAARLSKLTGKQYISKIDTENGRPHLGSSLQLALSRPWILLFKEPIVLISSVYMAIIYGTLYLFFAAFPIVYGQKRGWSQGISGLAFLGNIVGTMLAVVYNIVDNRRYVRAARQHSGALSPEARLPSAMVGAVALPIALFWFAWTNDPTMHWLASIAAGIPFGFGMLLVFLSILNYLIDAYTIFAASVVAANTLLRALFGAAFPLFTPYMYRQLGIHWASTIPAFLALLCLPFPFLLFKYGPAIRQKCPFAAESQAVIRKLQQEGQDRSLDQELLATTWQEEE